MKQIKNLKNQMTTISNNPLHSCHLDSYCFTVLFLICFFKSIVGLTQKTNELKEHTHQLETVLAQRETTLEELRQAVHETNQGQEERDAKFKSRIEGLEEAVKKEVEVQRDLRKQVMTTFFLIRRFQNLKKQNSMTLCVLM